MNSPWVVSDAGGPPCSGLLSCVQWLQRRRDHPDRRGDGFGHMPPRRTICRHRTSTRPWTTPTCCRASCTRKVPPRGSPGWRARPIPNGPARRPARCGGLAGSTTRPTQTSRPNFHNAPFRTEFLVAARHRHGRQRARPDRQSTLRQIPPPAAGRGRPTYRPARDKCRVPGGHGRISPGRRSGDPSSSRATPRGPVR